jgi:hypothetical protein
MASPALKSTKKMRVIQNSARGNVSWDDFHKLVEEMTTTNPRLALKSAGFDRRILEGLALLFWIHGEVLERGMDEHWKERRRNADVLSSARQKVIDAAKNLMQEEAWIKTRFQVCGTGRHTGKDIGADSIDYILRLQSLIDLLHELEPALTQLKGKRKPRIDQDQNFLLYLMAGFWKSEAYLWCREHHPAAAINREIATLVEAWRLSLGRKGERIDEKDVGRRIDRFRLRNEKVATLIDSKPFKFVLRFFDAASDSQSCEGLRQDEPSPTSLTLQTTPMAPTQQATPGTTIPEGDKP